LVWCFATEVLIYAWPCLPTSMPYSKVGVEVMHTCLSFCMYVSYLSIADMTPWPPRAGSGVVRIDPLFGRVLDLQSGGCRFESRPPRSTTQPSIPPASVNEYQLQLGRQRQVWLIPIADERVSVQVKLWDPSRTRTIPERFWDGVSLRRGAISSVCTFTFTRVGRTYVGVGSTVWLPDCWFMLYHCRNAVVCGIQMIIMVLLFCCYKINSGLFFFLVSYHELM